jgi:hypothetical protein
MSKVKTESQTSGVSLNSKSEFNYILTNLIMLLLGTGLLSLLSGILHL